MCYDVYLLEDAQLCEVWAVFYDSIEDAEIYITDQVKNYGMAYSDFVIQPRMRVGD